MFQIIIILTYKFKNNNANIFKNYLLNESIRLIFASHNFNANNLNSFRGSLISNEEA